MVGEESFERWQRSEELFEHPRPLTDMERSVLREAVAPHHRRGLTSRLPLTWE